MEYYLLYAGVTIILFTLMIVFPRTKKKEKEIVSLLQKMEERILDLKREMNKIRGELQERTEKKETFQGYLHQEISQSKPRPIRGNGRGATTNLKFQDVKRMLDKGYDHDKIAKELHLGHREIRLILKMKGWG